MCNPLPQLICNVQDAKHALMFLWFKLTILPILSSDRQNMICATCELSHVYLFYTYRHYFSYALLWNNLHCATNLADVFGIYCVGGVG